MEFNTAIENRISRHSTVFRLNGNNRFELRFWIALLILANLGLIFGKVPAGNLMFDINAATQGEWWRILTWPFAHVSRYHLLLDGAAFLLLYAGLDEKHSVKRLLTTLCAAAGSLILPLAISSEIHQFGLCGLSGIAHGLAATSAVELMRDNRQKQLGGWLLTGLLIKTGWELWTGSAFLQHLHLGDIGQPIVATHAGGILGGLLGCGLLQCKH